MFYEPANRVDLSVGYNAMENLTVFADFMNLTNAPLGYFVGTSDTPIQRLSLIHISEPTRPY